MASELLQKSCACETSDQHFDREDATDENLRMYRTVLQTQLLGVENPHTIAGGALNDNPWCDQENPRAPTKHNILNFSGGADVFRTQNGLTPLYME